MKQKFAVLLFMMSVFVFAGMPCATRVYAIQYVITDLGTLGGPGSFAFGINDQGQVVGNSYMAFGGIRAFLYENGAMEELDSFGSNGESYAWGINNLGQIVGTLNDQPFLYENGVIAALGGGLGDAWKINDSGQVAGTLEIAGASSHAFLYENSVLTDLGTLGGETSRAGGINNAGQVVGEADTGDGVYHAFIYENGGMADLGVLEGGRSSAANGINNLGQVVGYSGGMDDFLHAFLYEDGVMRDIGPSNADTLAWGINDAGTVVGSSRASGDPFYAFAYADGALSNLYDLVSNVGEWVSLSRATHVNNLGQIVGYGRIGNAFHGFLLTEEDTSAPVPEPATLMLLVAGFAGVAVVRRKKSREGECR